jgi:hypothetical protein
MPTIPFTQQHFPGFRWTPSTSYLNSLMDSSCTLCILSTRLIAAREKHFWDAPWTTAFTFFTLCSRFMYAYGTSANPHVHRT